MICTPPGPSSATHPVLPSTAFANSCANAFSLSSSPGAIFPFPGPAPALHQREMYLRALEQEREEILAAAYASKRSNSPLAEDGPQILFNNNTDDDDDVESDREDDDGHAVPRFDDRGRELHFRETVRQRQARLNFLRRQEFARRIAHRGLEDAKASAYAIKRLPPPRVRPIERVNAAIKIQRAYRVHRAVVGLRDLIRRIRVSHDTFILESKDQLYEEAWQQHAETLHALLRELGERTGVLASSLEGTHQQQQQALDPRVRAVARAAMEALRAELKELDRAQVTRYLSAEPETVSVSVTPSDAWSDASSSSSSSSGFDEDLYYDDDDEDEEDDDYSSYTYTPPSHSTNSLYVVDEEDEEELERFNAYSYPPSPSYRYPSEPVPLLVSPKSRSGEEGKLHHHQRNRHAPVLTSTPTSGFSSGSVPVSMPGLVRSPVSRSPSLASIPEEGDVEC